MIYVGSKNRISMPIVSILQTQIDNMDVDTYYEPFVGGANIIDKIECKRKIGIDNHFYLIEMFKALQKGWVPPKTITEEQYYRTKMNQLGEDPAWVGLVGFCSTFGAKWFGGYARCCKKDGTPRDRTAEAIRNLMKQIPKIKDVEFVWDDYQHYFEGRQVSNAVIYCDPPYRGTMKYSTGDINYDDFWDWVRWMSKDNYVFVSEYSAPSDFKCIWEQKVILNLDSRRTGDVDVRKRVEKLFVWKGEK